MKKRIFAILIAATVLIGTQVEANASMIYAFVDGDLLLDEEEVIESPYSEEIKEWDTIKDEWLRETEKLCNTRSSQGIYENLNVPHFNQENGHYCGPATVKQTIHYLKGSSLTQDKYAEKLHTTTDGSVMENIPSVINSQVSLAVGYSKRSIGSKSNYRSSIYTALTQNRPVIIDIKGYQSDGWRYDTNGHYLNIAGITSNATTDVIKVVDPNDDKASRMYEFDVVYKVNNQHPKQAFIW